LGIFPLNFALFCENLPYYTIFRLILKIKWEYNIHMVKEKPKQKPSQLPSSQKIKDNLKLAVSDPDFIGRAVEIRHYLGIPQNGFDPKTPDFGKKFEEWEKGMGNKSEEMMNSKEFNQELRRLYNLYEAKKISRKEYDDLRYKLHDPLPINYLSRQIKLLVNDFNLPINCENSIWGYIVQNDFWMIPVTIFGNRPGTPENLKARAVTLSIYAKLTEKDLRYIKHYVNDILGNRLPNINPLKDIDARIVLEKTYNNRNYFDEVEYTKGKISREEIIEFVQEETGKKFKTGEIDEILRSLKKLRQKRFKKNLEKSSP